MDILEVILLIVGIVIFIGSFLLPADRTPVESTQMRQNRKSTV